MLKRFYISFAVVASLLCVTECCHPLWYNECKTDLDCCSGLCFMGDGWAVGVCKPSNSQPQLNSQPIAVRSPTENCHELWYNHCTTDSNCCSGFCDMGPNKSWQEGVCKPSSEVSTQPTCRANWNNECHSNDECCSKICYMEKYWQQGVCQPAKSTIVNDCLGVWSNNCTNSVDCCSGYCDKGPESTWLYGICRSREVRGTKKPTKDQNCRKIWDNKCKNDIECCSKNCFMGAENQWEYGVCKPNQEIQEYSSILPLSPNKSESTENTACYPMFYEGCKQDSECCSSLQCDRKPGVKIGTCKPYTALKVLNEDNEWIECFENWYEYCTQDEECCSGICQQFDTSEKAANWTRFGACVPDIRVIPVELVNEILANHSKIEATNKVTQHERGPRIKRSANAEGKKVICYLGSWANYKPGDGKFVIEDIDASLCTHVVYGFAKLESNKITAFDPWLDLSKDEPGGGLDAYARFTKKLKEKNPSLKAIIAIGGWNEGSEKYSVMASSAATRETFADSVVKFLEKYSFDGLDIDWEYPSIRGGNLANDKENLNHLLRLLRGRLSGKLLTMAVAANPRTVLTGYDIPTIVGLLDYISVMSYDYHGAFDNYTGHNAPLYAREDDEDLTFNVAFGINFWLASGVPSDKLIMGLPLYGRSVQLADKSKHGVMESIVGPGENGTYSKEPGVLYYREICQNFDKDDWIKEWDAHSLVPYMYKGNQWISYDNEQSLALKVQFAMQANLGGIMFWSLEGDDFADKCNKGKYSLLNSAKAAMSNVIDYENQREQERKKDAECSESSVDGIAILSQLKSLWEVITGKAHCAKKTQENFSRKAPLISQIRSAVEAATGDLEAARQTQIAFLKNLEETIDGTPVLGHAKAAIHCAAGELEKCKEVALKATRPVFAVAGGVAGGLVGGPAGAIAGGVLGGTAFDGITTGVESAINHKYSPQGNIQSLERLFTGQANPSEKFDTVVGILGDAAGGYAGGKIGGKSGKNIGIKKDPKRGNLCRSKRAGGSGGGCGVKFFNDVETFDPVPGLRVIADGGNGPPRRVQRNPTASNRVEYVDAQIQRHHLKITSEGQRGVGSATNKDTRTYSKDMNGPIAKGNEPNDAGHILRDQLGGSGRDPSNIIPQSAHFNRGAWKAEVETLVHNLVKENGSARYTLKPIYDDNTTTRPSSIRYRIESAGQELKGDILNPVIAKSELPQLQTKDYNVDLSGIEFQLNI